ncbi:lytic transglycosylase domain-containing protein [Rhodovibrionaceae bacterium A322]
MRSLRALRGLYAHEKQTTCLRLEDRAVRAVSARQVPVVRTPVQSSLGRALLMLFVLLASFVLLPTEQSAASTKETAALPRLGQLDSSGLPRILGPADVRLYRQIYDLQEKGQWSEADHLIAQLNDRRLLGHVQFQRYMHPTAYRSKYKELKEWMSLYADHPGASRIYRLAMKRRPANYRSPQKPVKLNVAWPQAASRENYSYVSPRKRSRSQRRAVRDIKRKVRYNVLRTRLTVTEKLLARPDVKKLLDQVEIDEGYSRVAAAWLYYGNPKRAYKLASRSALRSGNDYPDAHWIAGLAAWRLDDLTAASIHFEALAVAPRNSGWMKAAGAYWAARANLRRGLPQHNSRWLRQAAQHPYTFYGLLARKALALPPLEDLRETSYDQISLVELLQDERAQRAVALLQVGWHEQAERELLAIRAWKDPAQTDALLVLAQRGNLSTFSFKLANSLSGSPSLDGVPASVAAAAYPLPHWQPNGGFNVDRALVYALVRQESAFNPKAKSRDGARGLMQLMPSTASYISKDRSLRRGRRDELFNPALNMDLGQRYIQYLLDNPAVQGDLFRLAAAYNGGPGNLRKWEKQLAKAGDDLKDPLLFIETLPSHETRSFIERVLTNLWIYRQRLNQDTPSLTSLASGNWPHYQSLD